MGVEKKRAVFEAVARGRLSDEVVDQIKKSIIENIYKPGEKLPSEKNLLEMFHVSRGSLREALKSLERMGFIVVKTGVLGGAYVTDKGVKSFSNSLHDFIRMNRVGLQELLEMREIIEPGMAALAAKRRTEDDVKRLEDCNAVRQKSIDANRVPIITDIKWHQAVAEASKNSLLNLVVDAIAMGLQDEFKKISLSLEDHRIILDFHKKVTKCIKEQDSKAALVIMRKHVADVQKRLKS